MRLHTVHYISVNCSTCFGWWLHPSSGVHITVITASGTGQTVSATFRCCGVVGTGSNYSTRAEVSRDGLTSTRCCDYSYMYSWWWVESPPETCRAVYRNIINSVHIVASCWTIIDIKTRGLKTWHEILLRLTVPVKLMQGTQKVSYVLKICYSWTWAWQ